MEIIPLQAEAGQVVPASHVLSRSRQAGHLPEDLEQAVIVEVQFSSNCRFIGPSSSFTSEYANVVRGV